MSASAIWRIDTRSRPSGRLLLFLGVSLRAGLSATPLRCGPDGLVGSRAGAVPRRPGLSVAPRFLWECLTSPTVSPSPAPATSNGAGGFPALRSPARFAPRLMRPATAAALSAVVTAYSTCPARSGLPPSVYPPSQVLQIDGCFYHGTPASRVAGGVTDSRAPSLHGHYPASPLLRAHPPPSRRQPISRGRRLYGLPSFRGFRRGTRRASPVARCALVAVLSLTTPPE
jgi:hypothetical protein